MEAYVSRSSFFGLDLGLYNPRSGSRLANHQHLSVKVRGVGEHTSHTVRGGPRHRSPIFTLLDHAFVCVNNELRRPRKGISDTYDECTDHTAYIVAQRQERLRTWCRDIAPWPVCSAARGIAHLPWRDMLSLASGSQGQVTGRPTDGTHGIVLWFLVGTSFLPEEVNASVWLMGQLLRRVNSRRPRIAYVVCSTETQACIRWESLDRVGRRQKPECLLESSCRGDRGYRWS